MANNSDVDLILEEVARGRTEAFGRVVREYALPLRAYLAGRVHHLDDVDDLAQEVFLGALANLSSFRRGEDFGAWLRGIARNKLLVHARGQARRNQALRRFRDEVTAIVADDLERAAASERAENIERLLECIGQLPERLRRIVRGGLDGERPIELADSLSTTVGVIYNLHHRANRLLRECLTREQGNGQ